MPRRKTKTLPLSAKWLPLIAQRLADHCSEIVTGGAYFRELVGSDYLSWASTVADSYRRAGDALSHADLWWVTRDMTRLAVATAEDEAGFDGVTEVVCPAAQGLVVFDGGLPIELEQPPMILPDRVRVDALLWYWVDGELLTTTLSADPRLTAANPAWSCPLAMAAHPENKREHVRFMRRILEAVWALSAQPTIAAVSDGSWNERRDGVKPRSLARATREASNVKLVYVRENRTPRDAGDGHGKPVDHDCRWIVRGHYRNQAYGPEHSLRRRQWIPPYVCGPADKPLRVKQTVHVWRR